MNYAEAVAYLQSRINYEITGLPDAGDLRLGRMHALLSLLGDSHRRYKIVHVAGTKGKGSTATMIAQLLMATGAKVGLHLSPHLERVEERMRVDGENPTPAEFASIIERVAEAASEWDRRRPAGEASLTFFELTTAAAFEQFARAGVDWAVVEVGVGGRLDATNVVDPAVSVIAEIGLDHTKTLGDTIAAIAAEKAGIIKPGRPVVASTTHPDAVAVIESHANQNGSRLFRMGRDFSFDHHPSGWNGSRVTVETWTSRREFDWRLLGAHQARNAALAWAAFEVASERFPMSEPPADALSELQIPGRMEVIQGPPKVVLLDVAHNEPSAAALADFLRTSPPVEGPRVLVFAASKDKNWQAMLDRLVDLFDCIVATQYRKSPRATPVAQLAEELTRRGKSPIVTADPTDAWEAAQAQVSSCREGLICITGSFFLASEIRPYLLQMRPKSRIE